MLHAAGIMFVTFDGRVLFIERSTTAGDHPGTWCFPGGSIDPGETARKAACREAWEEIGYTVNQPLRDPIDMRDGFATFRVVVGGAQSTALNHEHTRIVWARPEDAPQPLHPGVKATLGMMKAREGRRTQFAGVRFSKVGRMLLAQDARPTLTPIRPSAPLRIQYEKRVNAQVEEMANSLIYWVRAAYNADTPATVDMMAQDASPVGILQAAFDKLAAQWTRRFDDFAPRLSDWFVQGSRARVDGTMKSDLRRAGFTVKFQQSKAMRDAYDAVIEENIGLIKSVATQHLEGVRTILLQSVQNGRDAGYMARELEKRTGITKRRAARIARDQNNKATAVMVRTRALELGITKAKWSHSAGGKTPRPEHVAFNGHVYDLAKGHDFNNGEGVVWPGTAINCRCVSAPIVPGFD